MKETIQKKKPTNFLVGRTSKEMGFVLFTVYKLSETSKCHYIQVDNKKQGVDISSHGVI